MQDWTNLFSQPHRVAGLWAQTAPQSASCQPTSNQKGLHPMDLPEGEVLGALTSTTCLTQPQRLQWPSPLFPHPLVPPWGRKGECMLVEAPPLGKERAQHSDQRQYPYHQGRGHGGESHKRTGFEDTRGLPTGLPRIPTGQRQADTQPHSHCEQKPTAPQRAVSQQLDLHCPRATPAQSPHILA